MEVRSRAWLKRERRIAKMHILVLNWRDVQNPKRGGAEIILYELCKRLVKKGHSVSWFCSSFEGAAAYETIDGINIIRRGNKLTTYFHAFWYYRNLLRKPDLVLDCVNTICWQTPLYVEKKIRYLYANQSARTIFFYEYPFPLSLAGFLLEPLQYVTYKDTKAMCYSQSIKDDLVSFGIPKENISHFPLGIDHTRYRPGIKFSDPTFVFVGRFVKNKRPLLCIDAISLVIKEYPKAKLYLIGYGEEERTLRDLIRNLKLSENVFIVNEDAMFLEKDKRDMKVRFMQGAWALIAPSVKEGWGMVVTEAAACGTLAIVSDVTGLRDSTIPNKTGLVLSKDPSPKEIAEAMMKIIKNTELRNLMSREALMYAKNFSWKASFGSFYELLRGY